MACFIVKRVGLGFPSFAAKIGEGAMAGGERASSQWLHGSEAKGDRFDDVGCSAVEVR
jgi:hypothetical protein